MNAARDAATARRSLRCAIAGVLVLIACGEDPVGIDPSCAEAQSLSIGQTRYDALGGGDAVLDGSYIDYYSVRPDDPGTLIVEMAAEIPPDEPESGVDPFVYLWPESLGDPIQQAWDESGGGPLLRVARLIYPVTPGCYRVGASGWPSSAEGAYTIRADIIGAP